MKLSNTLSIALLLTLTACGVSVRPEDGGPVSDAPPADTFREGPDTATGDGGPLDVPLPPPSCALPDGRRIAVGESAFDGCNTCYCQMGGVLGCTTRACPDGGPAPNGSILRPGESTFDGCNTCICRGDGTLSCTARICPDDPPPFDGGAVCRLPDGRFLRPGESSFDGCNSCLCNRDGSLSCTMRFCPDAGPIPDAGVCVTADGRVLRPGESTFDGCNSCFCGSDARLSCTTRICDDAGMPDAGTCNSIPLMGPVPMISASSTRPPPPTGGTLLDGRYELVSGTIYGSPGGAPSIGRMTVQIAAGVWQMAVEGMPGGPAQRTTYWYMTSGTSMTLALVCGGGGGPAPTFGYDANPMILNMHIPTSPGSEFHLLLIRR
jgi:hypothetical protein